MATDPMLDPSDKFSIFRGTGDGSKTAWDINFAGGYIRREHIKAYTSTAGGPYVPVAFTWLGTNTINISPAVPNGVELLIYRDTPKDKPLVDFNDGSRIDERDLDIMAAQAVFAAAEMVDRFEDVSVDFAEVTDTANTALDTANSALSAAGDAVAAANNASVIAANADSKSTTALANAAAAVGTANAASSTATTAKNTADAASATATTAKNTADQAALDAASAVATAGSAASQAAAATATANTASTTANNASLSAGTALMTANTVREEFDDLQDTVEALVGEDLTSFVRTNVQNNFTVKQTFVGADFTGDVLVDGNLAVTGSLEVDGNPVYHSGNLSVTIAQVSGLQSALDGKQPVGSYAPTSHTHDASDITSGTLNAARIPSLAISKITNLQSSLDAKAPLNNPLFSSNLRTPNIQIVNNADQYRALKFMAGTNERWGHMTMPNSNGENYFFYGVKDDGSTFNVYSVERAAGTLWVYQALAAQQHIQVQNGVYVGGLDHHLYKDGTGLRVRAASSYYTFGNDGSFRGTRFVSTEGAYYFTDSQSLTYSSGTYYFGNNPNLQIGTGVFYCGSTQISGDMNTAGNVNMTNAKKRVHIAGVRQPSVTVSATAPATANLHPGDLWVW